MAGDGDGLRQVLTLRGAGYSAADPTWEQVEAALHALDGGNGGHVICEIDMGKERAMYRLMDPAAAEWDYVELNVGGQPSEYWAPLCPTLESAKQAARTFWQDGSADGHLDWHVDR